MHSTRDGPLLWPLLRQGSALAAAMVSHALVNLVDLWLVGQCGPAAVAGVHVATTINFLPMIAGNGISVASMALMARELGAGRVEAARRISSRSLALMLLVGTAIGLLLAACSVPCVELQGATGEARRVGVEYLLVVNLGTVGMFALMQTTASMRAVGETLMPSVLLLGANVLNLALDVLLIFGWPAVGVPAMGAPGSAYGTVLARLLAAVGGVLWLRRAAHPLRLEKLHLRGARGELRGLLSLGAPQSLQMVVRALAVIALTALAASFAGERALTALGVTTRLDTILLFSAAGFASAATTQVGHAIGAGQGERARRAAKLAAGLALAFALGVASLLWLGAAPLFGALVRDLDAGVLALGACYLGVGVVGQPFACFAIAASGGVNGAGRTLPPLLLDTAVYLAVLVPLAGLAAASGPDARLAVIWWALAATNVILAIAHAAYVHLGAWPLAASADRMTASGSKP